MQHCYCHLQQKSVHPSLARPHSLTLEYFVCLPVFLMTGSILWAWIILVLHKPAERCSSILHRWFFSASLCCRCLVFLLSVLKYSWGILLDSSHSSHFYFFKKSCMIYAMYLGILFSFSIFWIQTVFIGTSVNVISPATFFVQMQPHITTMQSLW